MPQMAATFVGKYERTKETHFVDFLKLLDVNFLLQKAATVSTPVMVVTESEGVWTIKTSTTLISMEYQFRIDEKFDGTTLDGREVTCEIRKEGNKFIAEQNAKKDGEKSTIFVMEFNDNGVIWTSTVKGMDVVCTQWFKRV